MRVLFINHTRFGGGGATIAAERLAGQLTASGCTVNWLVKDIGHASNGAPRDFQLLQAPLIDRALSRLTRGRSTISPLRTNTRSLIKQPYVQEADVIHLHNLHPDYFNYLALPAISANKPVFWTIHDMWPITGHCGFSLQCSRWMEGCGHCPHLDIYPEVSHDWTALEWKLKRHALDKARIQAITPSQWLADCVKQGIGRNLKTSVLPYGLDVNTYTTGSKTEAQQALGLAQNRTTILLASANLEDPRKPQSILCQAINEVADKFPDRLQILTFGEGNMRQHLSAAVPLHSLGRLDKDSEKIRAYHAADAFLFASRGDNLPLVIQESLSCGTPVIANRIGGVPEMVRNNETGLLVENLTSEAFHEAILELIQHPEQFSTMRQNARSFASIHFDLEQHTRETMSLYQQCLK